MQHRDDGFPFERVFTLEKLVAYWREHAGGSDPIIAVQAAGLLEHLEEHPSLLRPNVSKQALDEHHELIRALLTPVIPVGGSSRLMAAIVPPFKTVGYYQTPSMARLDLFANFDDEVRLSGAHIGAEEMRVGRAVYAYASILSTVYGIEPEFSFPFIFTRSDDETGLERHYKIEFDSQFIEVKVNGTPPELNTEDLAELRDSVFDIDVWKRILPPHTFEFHGFGVVRATEVTVPEAISALTYGLLKPGSMDTSADIDELEGHLKVILRKPDLRLGLIALERGEFGAIEGARAIGRSLLMSDNAVPECPNKHHSFYAQAFESKEPVIVDDLDACDFCTGFEQHLREQGYRNVMIAPLHSNDEVVGLLELASPNPGDVNQWNVSKLMQVKDLFATAINRENVVRQDRIQAVIKKHYTAIHPSVEWRFHQSAKNFMRDEGAGKRAEIEQIVFKDVYPLYGLSDIRGSSTLRAESIKSDLVEQLGLAARVVIEASAKRPLPALDELGYQLERLIENIESGLTSGDESSILEFLRDEVEDRFDHLSGFGENVRSAIQNYHDALDPSLGLVYNRRQDFEKSVTLLNERLVRHFEEENDRAQEMIPHYFERYVTDGVDYNIYAGESLLRDGGFDELYLRNLRIWQLMAMCGAVWELNDLKPELPISLDASHLILVQSMPLSIRFRDDEKQFDVDGAYNARYEIVKKRIDKARIRGTSERLTQPGQIAIVYNQLREAQEYRRYLQYLTAAGYLTDQIEEHELEDLQGVHGLRALRVTVADSSPNVHVQVTPDGEMETVKAES